MVKCPKCDNPKGMRFRWHCEKCGNIESPYEIAVSDCHEIQCPVCGEKYDPANIAELSEYLYKMYLIVRGISELECEKSKHIVGGTDMAYYEYRFKQHTLARLDMFIKKACKLVNPARWKHDFNNGSELEE